MHKTEIESLVLHHDNEGLCSSPKGNAPTGQIGHVDGPEVIEMHGFVATKHELTLLVRHWAGEAISGRLRGEFTGLDDNQANRLSAYVKHRIARIAMLLGSEVVDEIVKQVEGDFEDRWPVGYGGTGKTEVENDFPEG